ncbi:uncharacterized protein K02A2.6-like [Episyrphus balteatus]|uniref:uncharacterized protein K02A2.6-like n=1 Tax=Episyrphus balteatus TaxID=286459 RepID=UPI002486C443|nr:uncharacterized protein K02A2.6-like [Episyrphus balteatus]
MATDPKILELLELQSKLLQSIIEEKDERRGQEFTMDTLANNIQEFVYDPANGLTFESWYNRFEDVFIVDGASLDDAAKVRLLMRKMNSIAHEKYANLILPKKVKDISFEETIKKLKGMFGRKGTLFNVRFSCLQTIKRKTDDLVTYASLVNKNCEEFKLSDLSIDQFKCLLFVTGLQAPEDSEIRTRLLASLEDEEKAKTITLDKLISEAHRYINLKKDTAMIEHTPQPSSIVNAVSSSQKFNQHERNGSFQQRSDTTKTPRTPCWQCGAMHFSRDCTYSQHKCSQCKKIGHKEGYCSCYNKSNSSSNQEDSNAIQTTVNCIEHSSKRKFITVQISDVHNAKHIKDTPIKLQIDTASDISIISQSVWNKLGRPGSRLSEKAKSATSHNIKLIANFTCSIRLRSGEVSQGKFFVTDINLNLFGIDLCHSFNLWDKPLSNVCCQISHTPHNRDAAIASIRQEYKGLFSDEPACVKVDVQLHLKPGAIPVFRAKRPVAYSVIPLIEKELKRLEDLGIITPVDFSEWAAPIVAVRKQNGNIRICGDYSSGLNDALEPHQYPLPIPDDIFATLSNKNIFSHIDLTDAYFQIPVSTESRKFLTINTHKGLYNVNRLAPGVKSAPGAFQQLMDTLLAGLKGVAAYLDDIIISGSSWEEHLQSLHEVLKRLFDYGFRVKIQKCSFFASQIKYLGHIIDKNGLQPDQAKINKIQNMPAPQNLTQLRSFLGAVNYYGKFVKEMRQIRSPLDKLLQAEVEFKWSKSCQQSFDKFKEILSSDLLLTHYNPELPIKVAADASGEGIGAFIAHIFPDGTEKVVMHAARALTPSEKKYSQIEKEALGLIFAVTKFHRMIYGRRFSLHTDHKPLLAIFGSKKGIPVYTANRLQRWALTLMMYDFKILYVSTKEFGCVDVLSRLIESQSKPDEEYVVACTVFENEISQNLNEQLQNLPLTYKMIQKATSKHKVLQTVINFMRSKWPDKKSISAQVKPYFDRRDALSVVDDCLLFIDRIIIPSCFHKRVLKQLHRGHPGIERMKSIARSYVYWPNIDDDITGYVRQCQSCATAAKSPIKTTLSSWPRPLAPMERIHIDIAGPCDDKYYFIIVDAFSKWPEIFQVRSISSSTIIQKLNKMFSQFGDCQQIVSDNGTQFTSSEFQKFLQSRGIQHTRTAPYHPQSNGQAERFVDTLKRALKKLHHEGTSEENLETFLQTYRSTPNKVINNKSPAELFLGRKIKTALDLMTHKHQDYLSTVPNKQNQYFNSKHGCKKREYSPGDLVYAKFYKRNKNHWIPGTIIERIGNVNYNVLTEFPNRSRLIRSHANQLKTRYAPDSPDNTNSIKKKFSNNLNDILYELNMIPSVSNDVNPPSVEELESIPIPIEPNEIIEESSQQQNQPTTSSSPIAESRVPRVPENEVRRSERVVRTPAWFKDFNIF